MNRRERRMLMATLAIVVLALIVWVVRAVGDSETPATASAAVTADTPATATTPVELAAPASGTASAATAVPAAADLEFSLQGVRALLAATRAEPAAPWPGDPFATRKPAAPPGATRDRPIELDISGVFYSARTRGARIDGRIVFEGEFIDKGVLLVSVEPDAVEVEIRGERFRIELN